MVGFDPNKDTGLSRFQYGLAGATSGVLTRALIQPLDVVKIRFQLQIVGSSHAKYQGIYQTLSRTAREEGIAALWKGHVPAQALSITYAVFQFVSFELLTLYAWKHLPVSFTTDHKPTTHFACGAVTGVISSFAAQPFDVIRTRLIAQGEPKIYKSFVNAFRTILSQEGFRALYKGFSATLLQIVPYSGLQFGFYALYNGMWEYSLQGVPQNGLLGVSQSFLCGGAAGVCAKTSVYPLDVIKKRLQVQGFERGWKNIGSTTSYSGLLNCMKKIAQQEGVSGYFKGLSPSLVKAGFAAGANFCVYEQCCKALSEKAK